MANKSLATSTYKLEFQASYKTDKLDTKNLPEFIEVPITNKEFGLTGVIILKASKAFETSGKTNYRSSSIYYHYNNHVKCPADYPHSIEYVDSKEYDYVKVNRTLYETSEIKVYDNKQGLIFSGALQKISALSINVQTEKEITGTCYNSFQANKCFESVESVPGEWISEWPTNIKYNICKMADF